MIAVHQSPKKVTPSKEDYLKAIWSLSERREQSDVSTGELAGALNVSPPAVSKMLKQMERQQLVSHTPYYGACLTGQGRQIALKIVRRHRLLELFLAQTLNYALDSVHDEAERLEHHISDEFERRIDELLGHPRQCPHGSPIPTVEGHISSPQGAPLSEIEPPSILRVERLERADATLLPYLCENGLVPGAIIHLMQREPFAGDLQLEVSGRPLRLSRQAAQCVIVSPQGV
ncbi:MAG: metal-dependent transcriptional regulator [Pyrinomonadaceae bacterium]|nr:metal-dependent transcriptional regulator [Acidobacteriota bacterium]